MKLSRRTATVAAIAGSAALILTGCQSTESNGGSSDEQITLTITTFGTMGIDVNYAEYEKQNPNIKIEATNLGDGGAGRDDAYAKIAAGTPSTWATKKRDKVSVPMSAPPRMNLFSQSPIIGTSLAMFVPTADAK